MVLGPIAEIPDASARQAFPFAGEAFGLRWHSNRPLTALAPAAEDGRAADVLVEKVDALPSRPGGRRLNKGWLFADGTRFWFEGAAMDMVDGTHIRWCHPSATDIPHAVYGTIMSHVLAWRGMVPLHASAVAFGDEAILVAGRSGAGKSTLARALIDAGGLLVSDDLSAMLPVGPGETPMLLPGRAAIRLKVGPADDGDGPKRLDHPDRAPPDRPVRATMLLLLRDGPIGASPAERSAAMAAQIFRPGWMRSLPHARQRAESLLHAGQRIAVATMPPATEARDVSPAQRAQEALALFDRLRSAAV